MTNRHFQIVDILLLIINYSSRKSSLIIDFDLQAILLVTCFLTKLFAILPQILTVQIIWAAHIMSFDNHSILVLLHPSSLHLFSRWLQDALDFNLSSNFIRLAKRCKGKVWNGCCTKAHPCGEGDGDCDYNSECAPGLKCGVNNCPWFGSGKDCCVKA